MRKYDFQALRKWVLDLISAQDQNDNEIADRKRSFELLMEDVRIYEAELEVQNQQLREVNNALNQHQHYNRTLFENLPLAVFILSVDGIVEDLNDRAKTLLCIKNTAQAKQYSFLRLLAPCDRDRFYALFNDPKDHGYRSMNAMLSAKNGVEVSVELNLTILDASNTNTGYALVCCRDRVAELAMSKKIGIMQGLLDTGGEMVFAVDHNYCVTYCNKQFEAFCGLSMHECLNRDISSLFVDSEVEALKQSCDAIFKGQTDGEIQLSSFNREKPQVIAFNVAPLFDMDNVVLAAGFNAKAGMS